MSKTLTNDEKLMQLSCSIIDDVEDAIRGKHRFIDVYAEDIENITDEGTNTLLYGKTYYNLKNQIIEQIREFIEEMKQSCSK